MGERADFRGEYAVKAYLYKAVRNDCLNLMRHQQVEDKYARRVVMRGGFRIIFGSDSGIGDFQTLSDVFNELPPACKEVYQMSLDGKSHEEIAQTLNISVNTVKKHKNNANHYMRERLKMFFLYLLGFLEIHSNTKRFTTVILGFNYLLEITRPSSLAFPCPFGRAMKGDEREMEGRWGTITL